MNEAAKPVPRARKEIKLTPADERRFWAKVNKDGPTQPHMESPCWEWTASKVRSGYGQFKLDNRHRKTHRVAWTIANGKLSHDGSSYHGICVCHRCDYRLCVNPSHLFIGTQQKNITDRDNKGRGKTPDGSYCARLHPERIPRGEASGMAKLTNARVIAIRAIHAAGGATQKELGARFGVSHSVISKIVSRTAKHKLWTHI